MEIGIIGAGNIGGSLTRLLTQLGHDVRVANSRAPETLAELAAETGATAVWAAQAPVDADLVIVSIPQKNVPDLAPGIVKTAKPGAPVIETNNYYPRERDGRIDAIEEGTPESVWVAEHLGLAVPAAGDVAAADVDAAGGSPRQSVFKVFNGIYWKHLLERGVPAGSAGRIALPVAGDEATGKEIVFALVDALGFDPVDAGPLAESWRQQPGTPVYGTDLDVAGVTKALAAASPERPENFRAA
jgi:predicted dinucleotide-binding enzyme